MNCVACGKDRIQKHHVFPKRFFGQGVRVHFCQDHHREIEEEIWLLETLMGSRERKRLEKQYYLDLVFKVIQRERERNAIKSI
jgi:hypothetical protein